MRRQHQTSARKRTSGGQALVLVTFALIAMCGLLGLAVDLGWSFFVKKQAQAAADAGALAAVHEAKTRLGGSTFGFTCPVAPSTTAQVFCTAIGTAVDCNTFGATAASNLNNGCLYAKSDGFASGGLGGRQKVTIQAYDVTSLPPTAPGITDLAYWVTVRTVQTIPQLFSAVLGNREAVVSAVATAGLVSLVVPGSFIGRNQKGDCIDSGLRYDCGVDIETDFAGGTVTCSGGSHTICADGGLILASTCNGNNQVGCSNTGGPTASGNNYAGNAVSGTSVYGSVIDINGVGLTQGNFSPTPVSVTNPALFNDPTEGRTQPPLALPSGALGTCGIPNGQISWSGAGQHLLGPYQYYSMNTFTHQPDGNQITITGNVGFSSAGGCDAGNLPGVFNPGSANVSNAFPAYIFYGGLDMGNHTNFGPGQYIAVGTLQTNTPSLTINRSNPTITGDNVIGTQFITTAPGYPGLATQMAAIPAPGLPQLFQGNIDFNTGGGGSGGSVTLSGINKTNLPAAVANLGNYNGNIIWQDRRNSAVEYNQSAAYGSSFAACGGCTKDDGTVLHSPSTSAERTGNGVGNSSPSSPQFQFSSSSTFALSGNIYQPRGASIDLNGTPTFTKGLQIISGAIMVESGAALKLLSTTAPLNTYKVALIQ